MEQLKEADKLYLGSGTWQKAGWLNHHCSKLFFYNAAAKYFLGKSVGEYDLDSGVGFTFDIDHDLSTPERLPLADNFLSAVYTSHSIEHIRDCDAQFVFKDVHRILKPNGVFRVTCPDINILFDRLIVEKEKIHDITLYEVTSAYEEFMWATFSYFAAECKIRDHFLLDLMPNGRAVYDQFLQENKINETQFSELLNVYGKFGVFEYLRCLSEGLFEKYRYHLTTSHVNWWTTEKVCRYLTAAGFKKIFIVSRNSSSLKDFESDHFDYTVPHVSLFVEAKK